MKEITDLEDESGRIFGMHFTANVVLNFTAGKLTLGIFYPSC